MKLPDQDTNYVMTTFKPGEPDKRTIKFLGPPQASTRFYGGGLGLDAMRFKVGGTSTVREIGEFNQWLPEGKREAERQFLLYYFSELIDAVSKLDVQKASAIRAEEARFQTFLQKYGHKALKRYENDLAEVEDFTDVILSLGMNPVDFGLDAPPIASDFRLIDGICKGAGLRIHKVVGSNKSLYVQERPCSF